MNPTPMPRRPLARKQARVWPSVAAFIVILLTIFLLGAHQDDLRRECVERGGVPSDSWGYGVRCTELEP